MADRDDGMSIEQDPYASPKVDIKQDYIVGESSYWIPIIILTIVHVVSTTSYIALGELDLFRADITIRQIIWSQWTSIPEWVLDVVRAVRWPSIGLMVIAWVLIFLKQNIGFLLLTIVVAYWYSTQFIPVDKASSWLIQALVHMSILTEGALIFIFLCGMTKRELMKMKRVRLAIDADE